MSFLIIPLIILYDEYIDRSKLSEQKKPSSVYSPPLKWGRNNNSTGTIREQKKHGEVLLNGLET